jgi:hypothetical protein
MPHVTQWYKHKSETNSQTQSGELFPSYLLPVYHFLDLVCVCVCVWLQPSAPVLSLWKLISFFK